MPQKTPSCGPEVTGVWLAEVRLGDPAGGRERWAGCWTLDCRLIQGLNDIMSAKHLAWGLVHYQGLSECWQLSGSDALPAAACGGPTECSGRVCALRADGGWVPGPAA